MPTYTIYSTTTGEVRRHITCPQESLSLQPLAPDEARQEGIVNPTFRITPAGLVPLPPQPTPHHVFDYTQLAWVDTRTPETYAQAALARRQTLLAASDWTQLPDVPLATKSAWGTYRQALRDITAQPGYPMDVTWPVAPA